MNKTCRGLPEKQNALISDFLPSTPSYGHADTGRLPKTYISYVQILDVIWRTCQKQRMIGTDCERKLGTPHCQRDLMNTYIKCVCEFCTHTTIKYM